jgi:hypothetical protein
MKFTIVPWCQTKKKSSTAGIPGNQIQEESTYRKKKKNFGSQFPPIFLKMTSVTLLYSLYCKTSTQTCSITSCFVRVQVRVLYRIWYECGNMEQLKI